MAFRVSPRVHEENPIARPDLGYHKKMNTLNQTISVEAPRRFSANRMCHGWLLRTLSGVGLFLATLLLAAPHVPGRIVLLGAPEDGFFRLSWQATPGKIYDVESTVDLALPWVRLNEEALVATSVVEAWDYRDSGLNRYFRVVARDTSPPELLPVAPLPDGFAISREALIVVDLIDESGIDPASIQFSINGRDPIGIADPSLEWTDGQLQFASPGQLGEFGATIRVSVGAADILGHRSPGLEYSFRLELEPIVDGRIINIGIPSNGQSVDEVVGLGPDSVLLSRSVAEKGITAGDVLVGQAAGEAFIRRVERVSVMPDGGLWVGTTEAALQEVIRQGSLRFEGNGAGAGPRAGLRRQAVFTGNQPFAFGRSFDGVAIVNERNLAIDVGRGFMSLEGRLAFSLELRPGARPRFDAQMRGTLAGQAELCVQPSGEIDLPFQANLIPPISRLFWLRFGVVWIPVEGSFSIPATVDVNLEGSGKFVIGSAVDHAFTARAQYDGEKFSTAFSRERPRFSVIEPTWGFRAELTTRVEVMPTLSLDVLDMVGVSASLVPFLTAKAEVPETSIETDFCWRLDAGLEGRLGAFVRGVVPQEWTPFASPEIHLASGRLSGASPIEFRSQPEDQTLGVGEPLTLVADISACPEPSFEWLFDEEVIPGEVASTFRVESVNLGHSGHYQIIVRNAVDEVFSRLIAVDVVGAGPRLEVVPNPLIFAVDELGSVKSLALRNAGDDPLVVSEATISDEGFGLERPFSPVVVPPGGEVALGIQATDTALGRSAQLQLATNQESEPVVSVSLQVVGGEPSLVAMDDQWLFGIVPAGETARKGFVLKNTGFVPVTLGQVRHDGDGPFGILTSLAGTVVMPGEETVLRLAFSPRDGDVYYDFIHIEAASGGARLVSIEVSGAGGWRDPLSIHLQGQGQVTTRRTFQGGSWQEIVMNLALDFVISPIRSRHDDGILLSETYDLTGSSRVWGTAFDSFQNLTANVDKEINHQIHGFDGVVALRPNDHENVFFNLRFPIINDPRFDDGTGWLYHLAKFGEETLASVSLPPPFHGDFEFEQYPVASVDLTIRGGADMFGLFTGTLQDGETGAPVAGSRVTFGNVATSTDVGGWFEFRNIPANIYELVVEHRGFERFSHLFTISSFSQQAWTINLRPNR